MRNLLLLPLLVTLPLSAIAEEKKKPLAADQEAMMKAWQEFATPSEGHAFLKNLTGSWTMTTKTWMDPKAEPEESTGTAESKLIFGDRYVQEDVKGTAMGQPFEGRSYTGFNNASKKYQTTWIDTMGTGVYLFEGALDKTGKVLTMTAETIDPMTKKKTKTKSITRIESDNKHVFEMYETHKGKEVKTMEIVYTKKGTAS
jgi:hypothetical protein